MVFKFCDCCQISLESESTWQSHINGKRHRRNQEYEDERQCAVFVTNFPNSTVKHLQDYFTQFGPVNRVLAIPNRNAAKVIFQSVEGHDAALERINHVVNDDNIAVSKLVYYQSKSRPSQLMDTSVKAVQHTQSSHVHEEVLKPDKLDDQISRLIALLGLPLEQVNQRKEFTLDLQEIFRKIIPETCLEVYGSSVTPFGCKGSDLDIHFHLDATRNRKHCEQVAEVLDDMTDFPNLHVVDGYVTLDSFNQSTTEEQLQFISTILRFTNKSLRDFRQIPSAKVPVIKFINVTGNYNCDISFGSSASLSPRNTELLQLLCQIDSRFRDVVMAVRFWAKQVEVTQKSWQSSIPSYAMTLLVYFYMQNTEPAVLPTFEDLASIAETDEQCAGWDCSFSRNIQKIQEQLLPNRNSQTVDELTKGFFIYFANLDLFKVVICPRNGKVVDLLEFRKSIENDDRMKAFVMKDFHLQDPLELNHNVLDHVCSVTARSWISEQFIKAAVLLIDKPSSWSLRDILPEKLLSSQNRRKVPKLEFTFQLHLVPFLLQNDLSISDIEIKWHDWILEQTRKAFNIIRVDNETVEKHSDNEQIFSGFDDLVNSTSQADSSDSSDWDTSESSEEESSDGEVGPRPITSTEPVVLLDSDEEEAMSQPIIILDSSEEEGEEKGEEVDNLSDTKSSDVSDLPTEECTQKEQKRPNLSEGHSDSKTMEVVAEKENVVNNSPDSKSSDVIDLPTEKNTQKGHKVPDLSDEHSDKSMEVVDSPSDSKNCDITDCPTETSTQKGQKRPNLSDGHSDNKKMKSVQSSHHDLRFSLEKLVTKESWLKCCTNSTVWNRRPSDYQRLNIDRAAYYDLFSYEEAVTEALLENSKENATNHSPASLEFLIRFQTYTYGHNTFLKIAVSGLGQKLPDNFLHLFPLFLNKLINDVMSRN